MEVLIALAVVGGAVWWFARRRTDESQRAQPPSPQTWQPERPRTPASPASSRAAAKPEPRQVARATAAPATAASRAARTATRSAPRRGGTWIPLDERVEVAGVRVVGGLYVGSHLESVNGWGGPDPALIDPRQPVDLRRPDDAGAHMGYWPSYSEIHPASRGAYLRWLEAGRPGGAYIGYVFLFFYGLERRVLVELLQGSQGQEELTAIRDEVERLLALYAHNGSFSSYAGEFLALIRLTTLNGSFDQLEPPRDRQGYEVPIEVKLAAGAAAAEGRPLPGPWALSWALNHPEIPTRTPARRCKDELADLFLARYTARYGDGLVVKPNRTRLRLSYRPASASFGGAVELSTADLPDVTRLAGPTRKLRELVEEVSEDLAAYSRYVGKNDDRTSARALGLLPRELAAKRAPEDLRALLERVPAEGPVVIESRAVTAVLDPDAEKLPKRDAVAAASLLAAHGIALEPDVRVGAANFSHHEHVVLWRDPHAEATSAGDAYAAATVLLHLGVNVGASDGQISVAEEEQLEHALEHALKLPDAGRRRLHAHLRWLVAERPGNAGLKARIGQLDEPRRRLIAQYLVAVANADGRVAREEVNALRKLYGMLGLDPESVHRDLHGMTAAPVPVISADEDPGDFAIPSEVVLDQARLAEVMTSTRQVAEVLTAVFVPDEPEAEPEPEDDAGTGADAPAGIAGLDGPHSALVERLAAHPAWSRPDFDEAAADLDLLPSGAVETINDAAFELAGAPLLEGDDPIELDGEVLKEMLHA